MDDQLASEVVRRPTRAASRRGTLVALGGVMLAAKAPGLAPVEAQKRNNGRKRGRRRCKANGAADGNDDTGGDGDAGSSCPALGAPCRSFAADFCALLDLPVQSGVRCVLEAIQCCDQLERCEGTEFFACLIDAAEGA